jgi:hypothetical protein
VNVGLGVGARVHSESTHWIQYAAFL